MEKIVRIAKIAVMVVLFPIVLILIVLGVKSKFLEFMFKQNKRKDEKLQEEVKLVDEAIKEMESGLKKIKTSENDNPKDVEDFHAKYFKDNK
jgi:hypothetical protein